MQKLRILIVNFDIELLQEELPFFRASISEIAGKEHILFHNHQDNGYRKDYSLIQYKIIRNKASLVCIDEGVDEVQHFFNNFKGTVLIGNRKRQVKIQRLFVNQFTLGVWEKRFLYRIKNWIPFNVDNYHKYHELEYLTDRTAFLENILRSNIMALASGIGWKVDKEIKAKIIDFKGQKILPVKGVKKEALSLEFETNVFLPNYIGLGRHTSLGFGGIKEINRSYNER